MTFSKFSSALVLAALACVFLFGQSARPAVGGDATAKSLFDQGNFKDAYEKLHAAVLDPQNTSRQTIDDLSLAYDCMQRLNRVNELDAFWEEAARIHRDDWRPLWGIARCYLRDPHYGFLVAGKFQRGNHRGGGRMVNAVERDRVRALQLMTQAMPLALKDPNHADAAELLLSLASMLSYSRSGNESWRLQYLTDLKTLPDYEEGWGWYRGGQASGAPVDADGKPIFYSVPKTFESAENDGQRWRWCLQKAAELNPQQLDAVRMQFAEFLQNQFGVQTIAQAGWRFGRMATDDTQENESGTYALHTLKDTETIARLATGVKRFELPDEFNFIKIYEDVAAGQDRGQKVSALMHLAQIFENRRQYPKAADFWRQVLKECPNTNDYRHGIAKQQLAQIVDNWGRFEPNEAQPAGRAASIEYRFRNGEEVEFTAQTIAVEKLLDDVKALLKSRPKNLDWEKINIHDIGHRLVVQNERQYLGATVAQWQMPLKPRANHFDSRVTVDTPLKTPGAYLVTAKMQGGNTSKIVVWVEDTAIVKKPLDGRAFYYVADAASGKPIANMQLDFFGWQQRWYDRPPRNEVLTREFAERADVNGQVFVEPNRAEPNGGYQWLITAHDGHGRFAYLGFTGVWYGRRYDEEYNATKVFVITDRPVYRPGQTVKYKIWVRHAKYDMDAAAEFAGREFNVSLFNPKGEEKPLGKQTADAWGGMEGEYTIPADANLGVFVLQLKNCNYQIGGNTFRVEEYKKPEYEVSVDAPEKPVMLGDKITATIRAKYYFGSPVTHAKVKYKITRDTFSERWYPAGVWDWFYGPGYWWFANDYLWYPGWREWGCLRPVPFWWPSRAVPPELVADREVEIGPDGTVKVEIDTGVAKALHPDVDHRYTITAEVIDASRRTIVGSGSVLVARKPFNVTAWLERGYYRAGDTMVAHFCARTIDGKPVEGVGRLQLLKITYKADKNGVLKPIETPVNTWEVRTNAEGMARQQMTASEAGQYRVSYKLVASGQWLVASAKPQAASTFHSTISQSVSSKQQGADAPRSPSPRPSPLAPRPFVEGGCVFTVIGEHFTGEQFRFNHVELIPDKREYAPGEKVKLQINTDKANGVVLLFVRPTNGVYLPPEIIRLNGKSTVREIEVVKKDMPNFFIEAVTVADGRMHSETKEIVVPPEKRIVNVEIQPYKLPSPAGGRGVGGEGGTNQTTAAHPNSLPGVGEGTMAYKPGERAAAKIKLTDLAGKPFVGSTVVAIYDKSLEYISGGSNVPDIKEFFWKWRRHHYPQTESNLGRWFANIVLPNTVAMSDLGAFGGSVADDLSAIDEDRKSERGGEQLSSQRTEVLAFGEGGGNGMLRKRGLEIDAMAMPASAPAMGMAGRLMPARHSAMKEKQAASDKSAGGAAMVEPTVRKKFADTALWVGALTTDQNGLADVSLTMPENLTTWRIKAWAMGQGTRVGQGFCDVVTRKDLIIRLEAPRFFVQTDEVVLSAVVHNYLKTKKKVNVALELDGSTLQLMAHDILNEFAGTRQKHVLRQSNVQSIEIAANAEARVDWRVRVGGEGQATIRMKALTDEESDAMEQTFTCYVHGMAKMDSYSGVISPRPLAEEGPGVRVANNGALSKGTVPFSSDENRDSPPGQFTINVPKDRRPNESRLEVRWSPTLAGAMVDALPYLVDYTYGCTEQTLNRFLPTVITQKVLLDMKLNLKDIEKKQMNLNAQEIGDDKERAKQWEKVKDHDKDHPVVDGPLGRVALQKVNPVFDEEEVRRMVKDGVERLTAMQCSDGGWGWFSGWGEHSTPHTTAVVVHGLQTAEANGVAIVQNVLPRGVAWLNAYQNEQVQWLKNAADKDREKKSLRWKEHADALDAFVYMVLVDANVKNADMLAFLDRDRSHLPVYGLAMFGCALEKQGEQEKLIAVMRNIGQYVQQDDENQTAWLNMPDGCWWCWYGSEFEAEAYYLKLLSRTDPKGELARRLVKYLLNNRKNATYWRSTRDTALCIEAMADFIRASGENRPNMTVDVLYDGKVQKTVKITPDNLFQFDNKFLLNGDAIETGRHTVELKKHGAGPLYYNGYLSYFTLEDFIPKSTSVEVKVDRRYYKLVKADRSIHVAGSRGQAASQKVEKYDRQELKNLAEVKSGDLVEIELTVDSKNDYEYLIFEDMKPAGFEPVDLRSGYNGNDMGAYVEFRDNRVVFFVRQLARGQHSVAYRMRAETPGRFSALPTRVWAMYAPELRANSDEMKIRIEE